MYRILLMTLLFCSVGYAQSYWQPVSESETLLFVKTPSNIEVRESQYYRLDAPSLLTQLAQAPLRDGSGAKSTLILSFPGRNGKIEPYAIYEAPVLHPELGAEHPDIKSYIGVGLQDKTAMIRFSTTVFGFHGMILSTSGTYYIEPYTLDKTYYRVYAKKDVYKQHEFTCLTEADSKDTEPVYFSPRNAFEIQANSGIFRTYRLGLASTQEYSQYHINLAGVSGGTVAQRNGAVLAAMVVTMNRVNGIFERDMSLRMVIVPNNANVIFFLPEKPDSLDNNSGSNLINQIQPVMDAGIGAANYDIGHVFSTGGGGIAQLFSPCSNNKARGVTGQPNPIGDPFDVDYVAHEMGHQFGATHTQNNNCNRTNSTAVEPGSASTILGYAGICPPNVQPNSDAHFHAVSMAQMDAFVAGTGNCSANVANNNNAPVIQPIPNYTIPRSTAFILPGNATDADGDVLTYCWEQIDNQISTQPPVATSTGGPNFRSLPPSLSPNRYMPNLQSVLDGTSVTWEVVPSVARTMNFSLTVRDNQVDTGGQTARQNVVITTSGTAGPFIVNSPNTNVSWQAGSNQTVTWNVAGTTANGVNAPLVDIYLSSNGGTDFNTLLASQVPNDGSELVTMPSTTGNQHRIMVRGHNHIFYDVSNTNFTVSSTDPTFLLSFDREPGGQNKQVCQGQEVSYAILYETLGGFSGNTTFSVSGQPAGVTVDFSPSTISSTGTVVLTLSNTENTTPGFYEMIVTGTSGSVSKQVRLYLNVFSTSFEEIVPISPLNNSYGVSTSPIIQWEPDANSTAYDFELSTDFDFSTIIASGNVTTNQFIANNLNEDTNYFWRILPKNDNCQGDFGQVFRFTTGSGIICNPIVNSSNVPIIIPSSGTPTVTSGLTISENISIQKLTVSLNISHTWISDLTVSLISPLGTKVTLFSAQCTSRDNAVATFDDDGVALFCFNAIPTISGTLIPNQPLSSFIGESSLGVWTLEVIDGFNQDGGTINSWGITFCKFDDTPLACGQLTTTWNGSSWSNGFPVNNVEAIILDDLNLTRDMEACRLQVGENVQMTVTSGNNLIIGNEVSIALTSGLTMQNNANLIQINEAGNSGMAEIFRSTSPLMRLDYVLWSSPVVGLQTLKEFSPLTLNNRFYTYNSATNQYNVVPNPVVTTFDTGAGYLIRMPDNHPSSPTPWTGSFEGTPFNGYLEVTLNNTGTGNGYNLVGNPYPSTLNAEAFLTQNASDIQGTLYFWRKTNNAAGTAYATYTLGGATTTSPTSPIPNGTIQVGQGFFVAARNVAQPKVIFDNSMRVDNNNNQFFRAHFGMPYTVNTTFEKHRFWLNLTHDSGLFSQMMVGYMEGATLDEDSLLDGRFIGDSSQSLTSLIEENPFAVQARPLPFEVTDVVPLRFQTNAAGTYQISLGQADGLFETGQAIYLRDLLTQTVHDFSNGAYMFSSDAGIFTHRFEVVYQNQPLGIDDVSTINDVQVVSEEELIQVRSTGEPIREVIIYDVLGRTLIKGGDISNSFWSHRLYPSRHILLVLVELSDGSRSTHKIIH